MANAVATPTKSAEELNGLLERQTPTLISVGTIAQQLQAEPQSIVDFCQSRGIFLAPVYDGGEMMMDFNVVDEGFIRDFAVANLSRTLEPVVQQGVQAIASLRGQTTTDTPVTPVETPPTPVEGTTTARATTWKLAEKGKTMRETVVNLIAKNDPSGEKGFIQCLQSKDASAENLVKKVVDKHYGKKEASKANLWKAIAAYLTEMNGTTEETPPTQTKTRRPRKSSQNAAA